MKGYRTYLVSALGAAFGALATIDWNPFLSDPKAGWTAVVSALVMAVMRSITTTPQRNRDPSGPCRHRQHATQGVAGMEGDAQGRKVGGDGDA